MLITFSGLDGAGKTTLITELARRLESGGRSVDILTMYDDIGIFSVLRVVRKKIKVAVRKIARRSEPPSIRLEVDAKGNVVSADSWETRAVYQVTRIVPLRQVVYLIDVFVAMWLLSRRRRRSDVVLLDRYFYDSMVDIAAVKWGAWFYSVDDARQVRPWRFHYIRFLLKLVPKPDHSVFVDVPAEIALSRKVEYPLEYMKARRIVYKWVFAECVAEATVLANHDKKVAVATLVQLTSRSPSSRVG